MFEELCIHVGSVLVPGTSFLETGDAVAERHSVRYFCVEESAVSESSGLQTVRKYYCKGYDRAIPAGSVFTDALGESYDVRQSACVRDHFANRLEFNILTLARRS